MTEKDISKYADEVTSKDTRTIIIKNNGIKYVGYFNNNIPASELRKSNKWNFTVLQYELKGRKIIEINGEDILSIEITSNFS